MSDSDADGDEPDGAPEKCEVRIDSEPAPMSSSEATHCCLGLVAMSKGAATCDLSDWLQHHRALGVAHFFLRVEEACEATRQLLAEHDVWRLCVHATFADGLQSRDCGGMQTSRQDQHVQLSLEHARRAGCTHLLHVDDDELLYLPSGWHALHQCLSDASDAAELHVRNLEALAPRADCAAPFRECIAFRHRPAEYCGYGRLCGSTGKSIAVLRQLGLVPLGPHHFGTCTPAGLAVGRAGLLAGRAQRAAALAAGAGRSSETALLPAAVAVVLHFHCASLSSWCSKYADHLASLRRLGHGRWASSEEGGPSAEELETTRWADFHEASCAAAAARAGARGDPSAVEDACRRLWERWKLQPPDLGALGESEAHKVLPERGVTLIRPLLPPPVDVQLS